VNEYIPNDHAESKGDPFAGLMQADRELGGFDARTLIDDILGKLHWMRDHVFMEVPAELMGLLHDVEEATEKAVDVCCDLPDPPEQIDLDVATASESHCEGCSCGMPAWAWMPKRDKTSWFSFGFDHRHEIDGRVFDRNVIAKITAPDPRLVMNAVFGQQWGFEYPSPPDHHLMRDLPVIDVSLEMSDGQ
jgi:hypothetical protein